MKSYSFSRFRLELDEPVVVVQGDTWEKLGWGPYQFPSLSRTRNGFVRYTCNGPGSRDDIDGYEGEALPFGRVSEDGGCTWRAITPSDAPVGIPLSDGGEYFPPKAKNAFPAPWLDRYTPDAPVGGKDPYGGLLPDRYYAEKIPEFPKNPVAYRFDPASGTTESFRMTVRWPHLAMLAFPRSDGALVYPMECVMGIMGRVLPNPDGSMFFCTYMKGFSAETGDPAFLYTVTVLRSDDGGRTWSYLSEILTTPEYDPGKPGFEGFCEPCMERMTDGSVVMLMRTGSGCPSYLVRSTDECRTWSKPVRFDSVGVLPQLLRLKCGVTLASYGRPGVFLRAANDPQGLVWEEPVNLGVPDLDSCCYTSLLALDDCTALIAYSHFRWPNEEGAPVKTMMARKIRISV